MNIIVLVILGVALLVCTIVAVVLIVKTHKNNNDQPYDPYNPPYNPPPPPIPKPCPLTNLCQHGTPDSKCRVCVCDSGWAGQYCDVQPPPPPPICPLTNLCQHGKPDGECRVCVCVSGWTGQYCDVAPVPPPPDCPLTNLCQHGVPDEGCNICVCNNGWSGQYCDTQVQVCPCVVGQGVCSDQNDPTKCVCLAGFQGTECEEPIPPQTCLNNCSNNGTCQNGTCVCNTQGCKNGVMNVDCSQCICDDGWMGSDCNIPATVCMCSTQPHSNYLICMANKRWHILNGNTSTEITLTINCDGIGVNIQGLGDYGTITLADNGVGATWRINPTYSITTSDVSGSVITWPYFDETLKVWTSY
jgi:hypothetical protein